MSALLDEAALEAIAEKDAIMAQPVKDRTSHDISPSAQFRRSGRVVACCVCDRTRPNALFVAVALGVPGFGADEVVLLTELVDYDGFVTMYGRTPLGPEVNGLLSLGRHELVQEEVVAVRLSPADVEAVGVRYRRDRESDRFEWGEKVDRTDKIKVSMLDPFMAPTMVDAFRAMGFDPPDDDLALLQRDVFAAVFMRRAGLRMALVPDVDDDATAMAAIEAGLAWRDRGSVWHFPQTVA